MCLYFSLLFFQQDELKLEGAKESSRLGTNFHSDCQTWKSDILKKPFWNPEGTHWRQVIEMTDFPPAPASACQRRMGQGQLGKAGTAEVARAHSKNSKVDSCAFRHRTPWENTLGQPCCHLWSFYSRQVIYRNLFVQSQYLPVWAVKIYNSSVPLACCFPVNNGNFHHRKRGLG